jgi:hypothetical protein
MTPYVELDISQRLLAVEHVHIGYHLLPVCPNTPMRSGILSYNCFVLLHLALIHTACLQSCLATAIFTTRTLEDQTEVRPSSICPLHPLTDPICQVLEPVRTLLT